MPEIPDAGVSPHAAVEAESEKNEDFQWDDPDQGRLELMNEMRIDVEVETEKVSDVVCRGEKSRIT